MSTTIRLTFKAKPYTATFDAEGVVDTVVDDQGKALSSRNAVAATIIRHQEAILGRVLPAAMTKAGWRWAA